MTSISAAGTNPYQSPLQKLQDELQSEVNSGASSSSDKDALSAALTDIDSAMQASRASGAGSWSTVWSSARRDGSTRGIRAPRPPQQRSARSSTAWVVAISSMRSSPQRRRTCGRASPS